MRDLVRFPLQQGTVLINEQAVMAIHQSPTEYRSCEVVLFGGLTYKVIMTSAEVVQKFEEGH